MLVLTLPIILYALMCFAIFDLHRYVVGKRKHHELAFTNEVGKVWSVGGGRSAAL